MGRVFPERWQRFLEFLPPALRDGDLAAGYHQLLMDPDPSVHGPAALAWCDWEDTHVSIASGYQPTLRSSDSRSRLCFARLVTHYWANAGFLADGQLIRDATNLAGIPTYLAHGRRDISSPAHIPFALAAAIPESELFIAEGDGHGGPSMSGWMSSIADRLAG